MLERITKFSLENRLLIVLGVIGVIVGGVFAYESLPVDAFPDISPVMVPVFAEATACPLKRWKGWSLTP